MSDQGDQGIDPINTTQPDITVSDTFEISKRPRRTRKATKFYTPTQSITRRRKKRVKPKKTTRNEEPTTTGDKRKSSNVSVKQPKKMKVSEFTDSMRDLNLKVDGNEIEHRQMKLSTVMKADLITVRPVHGKKHVQQGRCFSVRYKSFERCTACLAKQTDLCRFNGIRVFELEEDNMLIYGPDFISMTDPDPSSTYETEVNDDEVKNVAKYRKVPHRKICQLCDGCQTTIFSGYWMCCVCGREYCLSCHEEWSDVNEFSNEIGKCSHKRPHYKEQLVPMYHYPKEEILRLIDQCNQMILDDEDSIDLDDGELSDDVSVVESSRAASQRRQKTSRRFRTVHAQVSAADNNISAQENDEQKKTGYDNNISTRIHNEHKKTEYEANEMTEEIFRDLWRKGYPFVIKGVDRLNEDIWKPEYFIEHYGETVCRVIDVKENVEYKMNVNTFFKGFEDFNERFINDHGKHPCLKLKDWPPKDDFAVTFPEHYKDFSNSLPFKEYTTRGGVLNLAHRLPLEINRPDLGPKMYNAYGSEEDIGGKGTTNLHLDITDAVNLMSYAPIVEKRLENERDKPAAAVWDLYHSAELPRLRRFLRKIANERGLYICHPIHDQFFYLDKELRERLTAEEGVTGWRVYQNPGDAVFIPAGCAHQVCNYTSCVKAAVDFVSPEGVARSCIVSQQFRKLRSGHKRRMDILQLPNILYHAWSTSWDESND
ncbi:3908_t:CDS:2 [Funneliformis mosseae]|uniref:3908_t:CDS:1 n=1 Tax=Funneliformis mosseae TaxID=27381 RepID=A0A9N9G0C8_FUNMO|nr:3908_t:CDS:2 [Funneliformis mosseae]